MVARSLADSLSNVSVTRVILGVGEEMRPTSLGLSCAVLQGMSPKPAATDRLSIPLLVPAMSEQGENDDQAVEELDIKAAEAGSDDAALDE